MLRIPSPLAPSSRPVLRRAAFALALVLGASGCGAGREGTGGSSGGGAGTLIAIDVQAVTTTTVPLGATRSFKATGHYSSGPNQDLTATAAWTVVDPTVATTVGAGLVKGLRGGTTQLRATAGGIGSNYLGLTVSPPVVTAITVSPAGATIAYGASLQYTATALSSDGSRADVTAAATWAATPGAVATITAGGRATGASAGSATIKATLGGVTGSVPATVSGPSTTLLSLTIIPAAPSVPVGVRDAFTATGIFDVGGAVVSQDLTAAVTWAVTPASVASISPAGVVTPLAPGAATVTATLTGRYTATASTTLHVTAATPVSLAVTPLAATVGQGTDVALAAIATFSDGSTRDVTGLATWVSSSPAFADVAAGVATGLAPGAATITATWQSFSGSATVTVAAKSLVSIAVTPSGATVPAGVTQPLQATGTFSDLSTQDLTALVWWTSSATTTAAVSNLAGSAGAVTAIAPGTATITATHAGVSGSAPLTVVGASLVSIDVTPATTVIHAGESVQYRATGHYAGGATHDLTADAVWSAPGAAVTISNAAGSAGLARGVSASGVPAAIVARLGAVASTDGGTAPASLQVLPPVLLRVEVDPPSVLLTKGCSQAFTATGRYGDGSSQDLTSAAAWSTLDPAVATTAGNLVTAVDLGVTEVLATFGGVTGQADLVVTDAVVVEITVSPAAATLAAGTRQQYQATAIYSDGSKVEVTGSAAWSVLPGGIATIDAEGLATGLAQGSAIVSAAALGLTGSTPLTVTAAVLQAIALAPTDPTVPLAVPQAFTATGLFSDGTREDLTAQVVWTSSDTGVATVSAGLAIPAAAGATTIGAARGAISASTTLTVTRETLVAGTLSVDQPGETIAAGTTFPFTVSGTFTDGSMQDLTELATWSPWNAAHTAPDASVATVSNAVGSKGLATGVARGTANIQADYGGDQDFSPLTVTTAVLVSVAVSPPSATVPAGMTQPLVAIGTFSDGSTEDLTAEAGWTSSATTTAAVSNAPGSEGVVTGIAAGTVRITATRAGLSGFADLTITSATLTAIDVTPATTTLPVKYTRPYRAVATYSDTSTRDVTTQATWLSSSTSVATVSNAAGSQGVATGVAAGTASVTATLGGVTSPAATLTVTSATLSSIAVTPASFSVTVSKGAQHTVQLTATGIFSDGTRLDLTRQCSWTSSAKKKAAVSKTGLVTGVVTASSVTITAKKGAGPARRQGTSSGAVVP